MNKLQILFSDNKIIKLIGEMEMYADIEKLNYSSEIV